MKKISANLTITTRKFLEKYVGVDYTLEKRLSHKGMRIFLEEKGMKPPKSMNINNVDLEDVASGKYIAVRAESPKKKKAQVIVYKNPRYSTIQENISPEVLRARREAILAANNLEYDCWDRVTEKITDPTEDYETYTTTTKIKRTMQYHKSFHKGKNTRK